MKIGALRESGVDGAEEGLAPKERRLPSPERPCVNIEHLQATKLRQDHKARQTRQDNTGQDKTGQGKQIKKHMETTQGKTNQDRHGECFAPTEAAAHAKA